MKRTNFDRNKKRLIRQKRTFNKYKQFSPNKPRLLVNKSNSNIYAQLILNSKTLASSSSFSLKLKNGNKENAALVGTDIGKKIMALNITDISFDRGGSKYHGRVAAFADAVRATGLKF